MKNNPFAALRSLIYTWLSLLSNKDLFRPAQPSFVPIAQPHPVATSSPKRFYTLVVATGLLLVGGLSSCGSSAKQSEETTVPKARQETNLLATATLDTAKFENARNELNLTGKITFNQDQVVKVFPLVGGHIETLKADLGDYVKKGQTLAVIRSGDLADLEQQSVSARGQLAVAQKNQQITEDMTKAGFSSQRDLVASRNNWRRPKAK